MHPTQPERSEFAHLLAGIQERVHLSYQQVADAAGVNRSQVWRWVNSGSAPGYEAVRLLAAHLIAEYPKVADDAARLLPAAGYQTPPVAAPPQLAAVSVTPLTFERGPDDIFPDMTPAMTAKVDAQVPAIDYLVGRAAEDGPLTGARIFPASPHEAERWDHLAELGYTPWQLIRLMAVGRVRDDERRAGDQPARLRKALNPV